MGHGGGQMGLVLGRDGMQQCKVIVTTEKVIESGAAGMSYVCVTGPVGLCALGENVCQAAFMEQMLDALV